MGTIKVDTIEPRATSSDITLLASKFTGSAAGNLSVTGEGGVTQTNIQQGLNKCWVTMDSDASTATTLDTFNVSSFTDNATGDYTFAINNDMADANYCLTTAIKRNNNSTDGNITLYGRDNSTKTASNLQLTANFNAGGSTGVFDPPEAYVQITGDLA